MKVGGLYKSKTLHYFPIFKGNQLFVRIKGLFPSVCLHIQEESGVSEYCHMCTSGWLSYLFPEYDRIDNNPGKLSYLWSCISKITFQVSELSWLHLSTILRRACRLNMTSACVIRNSVIVDRCSLTCSLPGVRTPLRAKIGRLAMSEAGKKLLHLKQPIPNSITTHLQPYQRLWQWGKNLGWLVIKKK